MKDQPLSLWKSPCVLLVAFPLLLLIFICSLCLIFVNLINMCLGVFRLGFFLFGTCVTISFRILGKFSTIMPLSSFFLSPSSETPMIQMLGHFTLSQRSLRLSSCLFFFSSVLHLFLTFYLLPHLSYLLPLLFYCWFPPECF